MKNCPNCGQPLNKIGKVYKCSFCKSIFNADDIESDDVIQRHKDFLNQSFEEQKQRINSISLKDLENLKKIIEEDITQAFKIELESFSDDLISKLPLRQEANESKINELSQSYTALDLINRAQSTDPSYFVAPLAMIRNSVEGYLKKATDLINIKSSYYVEKNKGLEYMKRLMKSDYYKHNAIYLDSFFRNTKVGLGLLPVPDGYKEDKFIKEINNETYACIDIPFRFYVAGIEEKYLITAYKYWKICNMYIHENAFKEMSYFDKQLLNYSSWKDATKDELISMMTDIYMFFKNLGIPMIGDNK